MKKRLTHYFTEYSQRRIVCTYTRGQQFEGVKKQVVTFGTLQDHLERKHIPVDTVNNWLAANDDDKKESILEECINETV